MSNDKERYLKLFAACEEAIELLIAAQRECEELYLTETERKPSLRFVENKKASERKDP